MWTANGFYYGWIIPVGIWAVVVLLTLLSCRWATRCNWRAISVPAVTGRGESPWSRSDAEAVLKRRLAAGEIAEEEYQRLLQILRS